MGFPWGLDLGSQNCVVAIARKGGIDVIDNEASSRKTPCMVGLGGKERGLGESAKSKITSNIRNTVADVKTLIGRRWAEEEVQALAKTLPWTLKEGPNGGILVTLNYEKEGEECVPTDFTPEQLLAMLLVNLKHTAEAHNKSPSVDCVISVPCYFNDAQRRAVLDAAEIAGVKCLRLMNDTTAIALNWGLPKSMDFDDEKPKHVLFYDMGYSATQCCIVAFTKTKMTVLASAFDRELGGRHFDKCMLDYFAVQWKEKTKLDLYAAPKSVFRLEVQVDKIKQQLSGYSSNTKLPCNVECMQEDQDFHSSIELDAWLEMTKPLVDRCLEPVKQLFAATKLTFDQVEEVEVVGSATRSPLIVNALKDFLGKEPKRTMNSEEAVSKGCALNAAMLSPTFRVRDFGIVDCTPYSIALGWTPGADAMDVESKENTVFTQYNVVPSVKMLTFMRTQGFDISASYAEPEQLTKGMPSDIGHWAVTGVGPMPDGSPSKVKVKVRIDANGIFSVDTAQLVEEVEAMEVDGADAKKDAPKPADDAAMADAQPEGDAAAADGAAEPAGGAEAKEGDKEAGGEPKEAEKKKKKVKKTDLPVKGCPATALVPEVVEKFRNAEYEMSVQDRMIKELHDRKNDLEAYIYSMRDRCSESGDLGTFIAPADREKFMPLLDEMENWLYEDEAETAQKSTFIAKLDQLKTYGGPCVERAREADERPLAFAELDKQIAFFTNFSMTTDAAYDHISQEDRDKVKGFADEAKSWASGKQAEQGAKKTHEPLAVTAAEIRQKAQQLGWDCTPIQKKPKPVVKKEEPAAPAKEEAKPAEGAAEGAPEGEAAPAADAPAGDNMDMGLD
eukprot:CAMPEP_0173379466 /NCGR_PEP_ID=MMETSP1356-20130122/2399_1 /TAXON_ID=77927 ORGANISM="Hemiselmis virescens, Strain PCC157" /NCGR_SAMPLE_ID=MMETSP1356 /ASSEMBLY_ACC=CAM_ASM_000847 /LENGTH=841 /DNA_ID=CAMNT_0014332803 /DNA_START=62 /DNA_END=2587 /DNA_ORIENTATION=-